MSDHEPTIFHNTSPNLVYHFQDPSLLDYSPSQSSWPQDKKHSFPYSTYQTYPGRPSDTDLDSWSPSVPAHFSHFPHPNTATQAQPITLANHEQYTSQVKQEDLAMYSGFSAFDHNQSFGANATMHHVQQAQHQHSQHPQAQQQSWSPLTQPSPLTPSPPVYQQQLSPIPVPLHQPRPVVPQAQQSQATVSSPHYPPQNHNTGSPSYHQTIDHVMNPRRQHHSPSEQQYIRPAEISPPESSATSVLSGFDTSYGFMTGPDSVGVESDQEGDYGPNTTVTRSEGGVWNSSGITGTIGMTLHDDDADGEDDDGYGTSEMPNELMFQVQRSALHQQAHKELQETQSEPFEDEDELDNGDDDDSSDPEYAPNIRARPQHRPLSDRRTQQRQRVNSTTESPYHHEGRSLRLRNHTINRYSPYAGYHHPFSLYSYSSPNITISSYPIEAGYGNPDDTLNGHRYATRTRRTASDPVPFTGANGPFSSSYQLAVTPELDSAGIAGRRRSRPSNVLPIPIPIPNLTKKSRGRRVPTVESLIEPEVTSPTSNTPSTTTASGRIRRAAAPSRSMAETGSAVPSAKGRSFECTVEGCGKLFARGEHLKRHIRSIHTYEKPHQCPVCGKDFSRHDNLNQHLRVHKGQTPARNPANSGYRA